MLTPQDVVERFIHHVWNEARYHLIPELVHPEYAVDGTIVGPGFVIENVRHFRESFANARVSILECVAEGPRVATLVRLEGTHVGPWKGMAATGNAVDYREAAFWRVDEGRITSGQFIAESLTLRIQLGQIPVEVWKGQSLTTADSSSSHTG